VAPHRRRGGAERSGVVGGARFFDGGFLMSDPSPAPSGAAPPPPPRVDPTPPKLPPPNAAKPPPKPARRMPAAVLSLGALVVLALVLIVSAPYWAPLLPWSAAPAAPQRNEAQEQMAQQLAAIRQQLGQLTNLANRVQALENRPAPDPGAAIAPLAAQVQQLGTRFDQVEKQLAQLAHDAASNAESPQRVLMVALAGLGNAVASSRPFAAELASVEALGHGRPGWTAALQPLDAPAKTGIPSIAVLAQRFANDTAPAILRAAATAQSREQSLGEAMLTRLKSLVIIRRIEGSRSGTSTDPSEQAVDEAQAALNKGDLAGAVKALGALTGVAADAAQPWLKEAQERVEAEQVIAKLSRDLAGDIAAGASGG
jgi:hypothetical protein